MSGDPRSPRLPTSEYPPRDRDGARSTSVGLARITLCVATALALTLVVACTRKESPAGESASQPPRASTVEQAESVASARGGTPAACRRPVMLYQGSVAVDAQDYLHMVPRGRTTSKRKSPASIASCRRPGSSVSPSTIHSRSLRGHGERPHHSPRDHRRRSRRLSHDVRGNHPARHSGYGEQGCERSRGGPVQHAALPYGGRMLRIVVLILAGLGPMAARADSNTVTLDPIGGAIGFTGRNLGEWALGYERRFGAHHGVLAENTWVHVQSRPVPPDDGRPRHRVPLSPAAARRAIVAVRRRDRGRQARLRPPRHGAERSHRARRVRHRPRRWRWSSARGFTLTARLGLGYARYVLGGARADRRRRRWTIA